MEQISCLQKIREIYSELKDAEKRVAEYILQNPQDIIHRSITELAEACKSGEATIFRLCKKLGYKGYQELKIKIASEVVSPIKNIHEEIKEEDNSFITLQKIVNSNIYSLNQTMKLNSGETIDKAVELLNKSEKIAFFGMAGSAALALDAYNKFIKTNKRCEFQADTHFQAMIAAILEDKDCVIAISHTGSNKELIENLITAKENGAKIISITSNGKAPIAKVSDVVLVSFGRESKFKTEAMDSRISALALIDCLFVGVCLKNKDEYFKRLDKVRSAIAKKKY
ncbi:MurR/RpiR family transcriptional regulator [Clostridium sp. SYSU_GA19001]|uniref:MurR/RpiR family transcriptional regulator n=1 Tax=Clostridium caldaquaticum TaxID=2940653 RepID=UPI0020776340|nr:MurR/RpiR family transcriptional regulator [Clostridium caldaquaticum]MCM8712017.1 MurR/RpiR family transcriptional regulator [Clostridium caldaquaticum]